MTSFKLNASESGRSASAVGEDDDSKSRGSKSQNTKGDKKKLMNSMSKDSNPGHTVRNYKILIAFKIGINQ